MYLKHIKGAAFTASGSYFQELLFGLFEKRATGGFTYPLSVFLLVVTTSVPLPLLSVLTVDEVFVVFGLEFDEDDEDLDVG